MDPNTLTTRLVDICAEAAEAIEENYEMRKEISKLEGRLRTAQNDLEVSRGSVQYFSGRATALAKRLDALQNELRVTRAENIDLMAAVAKARGVSNISISIDAEEARIAVEDLTKEIFGDGPNKVRVVHSHDASVTDVWLNGIKLRGVLAMSSEGRTTDRLGTATFTIYAEVEQEWKL